MNVNQCLNVFAPVDPEPFVQEQALALIRNLVDGCIKSIELVFSEDGMILDAVGRQLQRASKDEICTQVRSLSVD